MAGRAFLTVALVLGALDDSDAGERLTLFVGLIALGMLVPALGTLVFLKRRQRRPVAQAHDLPPRIPAEERTQAPRLTGIRTLTPTLGCDKVGADRPRARGEQVTDESELRFLDAEADAVSGDFAQLGDRVAAVLQTAEDAAEQIRADARTAVEQLTRETEEASRSLLENARSEAMRVRVEADTEAKSTREAVESYATNHRREAEEKAATLLADAEAQARAAREAAEAMARRIEERARALEEEVREQEQAIRGRMQHYLAALRDLSGQLEDVLAETGRGEPALVEALDVELERAQQES